jgi:two-component system, NarL family, response regulator DesR
MGTRVLIADDSAAVRTALRQLLARPDREILEAEDGAQALATALETSPDIAVIDLVMPNMDGLAAAREISTRLPGLPIVMCTMHGSPQLQVEALKVGVTKVISKADGGQIVSLVEELLTARQFDPSTARAASPDALPPPSVMEEQLASAKESQLPSVDIAPDIDPPKSS